MADKDMLGIHENTSGPAKLDRKDANGNKLGNIVWERQVILADGSKATLAEFYHPTDTLTTLAQVAALGYKNFAPGSTIRTPTKLLIKTSLPGAAEAWSNPTVAALA